MVYGERKPDLNLIKMIDFTKGFFMWRYKWPLATILEPKRSKVFQTVLKSENSSFAFDWYFQTEVKTIARTGEKKLCISILPINRKERVPVIVKMAFGIGEVPCSGHGISILYVFSEIHGLQWSYIYEEMVQLYAGKNVVLHFWLEIPTSLADIIGKNPEGGSQGDQAAASSQPVENKSSNQPIVNQSSTQPVVYPSPDQPVAKHPGISEGSFRLMTQDELDKIKEKTTMKKASNEKKFICYSGDDKNFVSNNDSDVTIVILDKDPSDKNIKWLEQVKPIRFFCHRAILSSKSPVYKQILATHTNGELYINDADSEFAKGRVQPPNANNADIKTNIDTNQRLHHSTNGDADAYIDSGTMGSLLEYMYTGRVYETDSNALHSIVKAADKFNMSDYIRKSSNILIHARANDIRRDLQLELATKHGAPQLKAVCVATLCTNMGKLRPSKVSDKVLQEIRREAEKRRLIPEVEIKTQ